MKKALSAIVGLILALGCSGLALAQSADPCALYQWTTVDVAAGTPTAAVVKGASGKAIYVCQVVAPIATAATGVQLTLSYGEVGSGTPCATATPGGTLAGLGGGLVENLVIGGGNKATQYVVPASSSSPYPDLCGLVAGGNAVSHYQISYVQVKQ